MKTRNMAGIKNQLMVQSISRWHIVPTITTQTVADHTYGVIVISRWIWLCMMDEASRQGKKVTDRSDLSNLAYVLIEALEHDQGEVGLGDKPHRDTSIREAIEKFARLNITQRIVSLADRIEAMLTMDRLAPTKHGQAVREAIFIEINALSQRMTGIAELDEQISLQLMCELDKEWDYSVGSIPCQNPTN